MNYQDEWGWSGDFFANYNAVNVERAKMVEKSSKAVCNLVSNPSFQAGYVDFIWDMGINELEFYSNYYGTQLPYPYNLYIQGEIESGAADLRIQKAALLQKMFGELDWEMMGKGRIAAGVTYSAYLWASLGWGLANSTDDATMAVARSIGDFANSGDDIARNAGSAYMDDFIGSFDDFERLKGGVKQATVTNADPQMYFNQMANKHGVTLETGQTSFQVDELYVGLHTSSGTVKSSGAMTLDINYNGQIYKIRFE